MEALTEIMLVSSCQEEFWAGVVQSIVSGWQQPVAKVRDPRTNGTAGNKRKEP